MIEDKFITALILRRAQITDWLRCFSSKIEVFSCLLILKLLSGIEHSHVIICFQTRTLITWHSWTLLDLNDSGRKVGRSCLGFTILLRVSSLITGLKFLGTKLDLRTFTIVNVRGQFVSDLWEITWRHLLEVNFETDCAVQLLLILIIFIHFLVSVAHHILVPQMLRIINDCLFRTHLWNSNIIN